jgi:alpha-L-arabinofuranosidase
LEIKAVKVASDEQLAVDMVSLFPQKTFRNRKNGLRKDLAQMIADIKPRFVRFPGGCVAHGNGMDIISIMEAYHR